MPLFSATLVFESSAAPHAALITGTAVGSIMRQAFGDVQGVRLVEVDRDGAEVAEVAHYPFPWEAVVNATD